MLIRGVKMMDRNAIQIFRNYTVLIAVALGGLLAMPAGSTVAAQEDVFGYYEVVGASSLNIRERPYLSSRVLTVANEGEFLIKWKRFCSLRPWCPVQKGDVRGWAGKKYLAKVEGE
jgi:hypothetical protein